MQSSGERLLITYITQSSGTQIDGWKDLANVTQFRTTEVRKVLDNLQTGGVQQMGSVSPKGQMYTFF